MENASKALIIAGAILIAILLISVGIFVLNSMNKPIDQVSQASDSQAVQMFNSKFINYSGQIKTVSEIKSLVMLVIANNSADPAHKVGFRLEQNENTAWYRDLTGSKEYPISSLINELDPNKKYQVVPLYAKKDSSGRYFVNSPSSGGVLAAKINTEIGYIVIFQISEV